MKQIIVFLLCLIVLGVFAEVATLSDDEEVLFEDTLEVEDAAVVESCVKVLEAGTFSANTQMDFKVQ